MSALHAVHSSASWLCAAHNTHACGNAWRSSANPVRRALRRRSAVLDVTLSNFGAPKFDSVR
jgi:hypothetical protein